MRRDLRAIKHSPPLALLNRRRREAPRASARAPGHVGPSAESAVRPPGRSRRQRRGSRRGPRRPPRRSPWLGIGDRPESRVAHRDQLTKRGAVSSSRPGPRLPSASLPGAERRNRERSARSCRHFCSTEARGCTHGLRLAGRDQEPGELNVLDVLAGHGLSRYPVVTDSDTLRVLLLDGESRRLRRWV